MSAFRRSATPADFWAIPELSRNHELVAGDLLERAGPSGEHGDAQAGVVAWVRPAYQRPGGARGPGGWWILTEVEIALGAADIVRPDVVGFRREHCPQRPLGTPVTVRPDWICEVVSEGNAARDTVQKLRLYHQVGIPHFWLVDPRDSTLTVLRHSVDGFITVVRAERHEIVRPEPFGDIELPVGTLFGDDPPE